MFEVFIAVFGILFYSTKYCTDRRETRQACQQDAVRRSHRGLIRNIQEETKLRAMFIGRKFDALNEISDSLTRIFGSNWMELFQNEILIPNLLTEYHCHKGFFNIWDLAYAVYLSKHGYAPSDRYRTRWFVRGVAESGFDHSQSYRVSERACMEIERNIRAKHGDAGFRLYWDENKPDMLVWEYVIDGYGGAKERRLFAS